MALLPPPTPTALQKIRHAIAGAFESVRRRLLWRVRRKLVLSYVFIGVVPALLIVTFFLLCGLIVFFGSSSFMARNRIAVLVERAHALAEAAAARVEALDRAPEVTAALTAWHRAAAARTPGLSVVALPASGRCGAEQGETPDAVVVGPWAHDAAPRDVPAWVPCEGTAIAMVVPAASLGVAASPSPQLVARGVAWTTSGASRRAVIVDIALGPDLVATMRADSGVEVGDILGLVPEQGGRLGGAPVVGPVGGPNGRGNQAAKIVVATQALEVPATPTSWLHRRVEWVAFLGVRAWADGSSHVAAVRTRTSLADVYERLTDTPTIGDLDFGSVLLIGLAIVAGLFFVIQAVAVGIGWSLARSITGAVHALFVGTERIASGDFTHKIAVHSRDQLGELATSFNTMTTSIEHLLEQKAEKERLAQELFIARAIQMSLLPRAALATPGLTLSGHCEPAREVGGDYYDVLPIDDHRVGILIADVSGKGASAALYMAELKGIVIALSQQHTSPRQLLIEANRLMSRHLDNRSFITATYLVIDFAERTLRYARAGHCPLIYVPGAYAVSRHPQILTPDGLVLGLQLDDGRTFVRLLEEVTIPLGGGDVLLLYTDGISEATDPSGDFFGDTRLAELVHVHRDLTADELRARILGAVTTFAATMPQQDDMTMVVMKLDAMSAVS